MRHSDYWRKRFEQLEDAQLNKGLNYYNDLERQYKLASKEIEKQIANWYMRFAKNNQISFAEAKRQLTSRELKEFKWSVQEYIKYGKENAITGQWMTELENASARVHVSRLEALKLQMQQQCEVLYGNQVDGLDKTMRTIYRDGYYHTAYDIQRGFNVGYDLHKLNENQLSAVISKPWTADGRNFVNRCWTAKADLVNTLHTELTQAVIRGDAPDKAIKTIAQKFNTSKSNAGRLVMTESAFFASASQRDCFNDLDVERYEIVATLDSHTSPTCQSLDGKLFDMKDFQVGVTAPPFHCWCRTVTVPYFDDNTGSRAARGEDGKTYYVPDTMKYPEWKKTFVDGGSKDGLKQTDDSVTIRNKTPFSAIIAFLIAATTIKEAEEFANKTLGIQNVSYKGVDVTTANAWNEGLKDSFDRFPELKNNFGFVGEAHERNTMLKPIAKQHYMDDLAKLNPTLDATILEPYADKKVRSLMKSLQIDKATYAQSWAPANAPFSAFRGVTVNREWGKKSAEFVKSIAGDVAGKFHPIGCDTIKSILDHEIGHQLDSLLGIKDIDEIKKLFDSRTQDELTNGLSKYSWKNKNANRYSEMIAEGWSEYCNNPQPRELAKTIGETIEAEYKKKFGTT